MSAYLVDVVPVRQLDNNGAPVPGSLMHAFQAGTTTPQAIYTDSSATTQLSNPIVADANGYYPQVWGLSNAYKFEARLSDDVTVLWQRDNVTAPASALSFLATMANYASSIGSTLIGFLQRGGNAVLRTLQSKLQEQVSAFDFMTAAQIADVEAGTTLLDVTAAIQAAVTASAHVELPSGAYLISAKIQTQMHSRIVGKNGHSVTILGNHSGVIFECPVSAYDCEFGNITFDGAGCTGIAVAAGGGTLQGYLIRPNVHDCHFTWAMAYGINADMIYARILRNTFGYEGTGSPPAPGTSTMQGVVSHSVSSNNTNLNTLQQNIFRCGGLSAAALDISGGIQWMLELNDFSFGGVAILCSNAQVLEVRKCWFEGNNATNALIQQNASGAMAVFDGNNILNNTCDRIFGIATGATFGTKVMNHNFGLNSPTSILFDGTTLSRLLPADGSFQWYDNVVTGGGASNKIFTTTEFRGGTLPRGMAIVDTTSSGTVVSSNDAGLTLSKGGTGVITLNVTHPAAATAAKVTARITSKAGICRYSASTTLNIGVLQYDVTGTPVEGVFNIEWGGAP